MKNFWKYCVMHRNQIANKYKLTTNHCFTTMASSFLYPSLTGLVGTC